MFGGGAVTERDELLAAVRARLQRVAVAQDLPPVLEPEAITEARRLAATLADDDGDLQARYLLGWLHWRRFQALPEDQGSEGPQAAADMFLPCFCYLADTGGLPEPLLPVLAEQAIPIAIDWLEQALGSTNPALMSAVVGLWQRILNATPADHPDRAGMLTNLGWALHTQFERTGAMVDLETAIETLRAAVDAAPADHPDWPGCMGNLGNALHTRFKETGLLADLETAIETLHAAVEAAPAGHPGRPMFLNNLGIALQSRFGRAGAVADLDAAIEIGRAAVVATRVGHPERPGYLSNLGNAVRERFERTG